MARIVGGTVHAGPGDEVHNGKRAECTICEREYPGQSGRPVGTKEDDEYVIAWSGSTFVQDMSPREAAEYGVYCFLNGIDATEKRDHVSVSVRLFAAGTEIEMGEFEVPVHSEREARVTRALYDALSLLIGTPEIREAITGPLYDGGDGEFYGDKMALAQADKALAFFSQVYPDGLLPQVEAPDVVPSQLT